MQRRKFLSSSLGLGLYGTCGRRLILSAAGASIATSARAADIPVNTWVRRASPVSPLGPTGPNKHVKMDYNSSDKKVYLIGGDYTVPNAPNGASHEMVYRYDVATDTWENVLSYANSGTAGFPEGRCAPGWTYDSKRDVFWFGMGQNRQETARPGLLKGGLWSFDAKVPQNQAWKLEGPDVPNAYSLGSSKIPRDTSDVWYMRYDPATDALYAAYSEAGKYMAKYPLTGVTIRNGVSKDNWTHSSIGMPDYYLGTVSFALDSKRGKFVFYFPWPGLSDTGPGTNRGETWEYTPSNNAWKKLSSTVLPAKSAFGMVYDSNSDKIVMIAGYDSHESGLFNPLSEIWTLDRDPASPDYHAWVRVNVAGTPPTGRKGETSAYDVHNNCIVLFGGRGWDTQPDASDIYLLRLGPTGPRPVPPANLQAQ